jgi:hypothetical protein
MNIEFNKNEDALKMSLSVMQKRLEKIYEGGGRNPFKNRKKKINSQQEKGLTTSLTKKKHS